MGKPGGNNSAIVAVTVDAEGQVKFDAIVKQGRNMNKIVQSSLNDIKEKEEMETAEKTRNALELLLNGKIKSSLPTTVTHTKNIEEPTYIRYTTDPNAPG